MNKLAFLPASLVIVSLVACGPNTPDPTTLSFQGSGSAPGAQNTTSLPLTAYFWGTKNAAGTLNADKTVNLRLTPAMYAAGPTKTLSDWKNSFDASCNTSGLNITTNTTYWMFSRGYYQETATVNRYLTPGSYVTNADGTESFTLYFFYFVKSSGAMSGTVTCGTEKYSYDLTLKPGWNIATDTYTINPSTGALTTVEKLQTVSTDTSYNGPWISFYENK